MNPPNHKPPGSSEKWLKHAQSDLHYAMLGYDESSILAVHVCFHAQQAVEKAIKAVLLHHHMDFPLVHDLDELIEIARKGGLEIPPFLVDVDLLTPYAVETRYPADWDEITELDVDLAISLAKRVLTWADKVINKASKQQ